MSGKYLFIPIGFLLMMSCQQSHKTHRIKSDKELIKTTRSNYKIIDSQYYNSKLLNEYAIFINQLDDKNMASSTIAAKKYVELFKGQDSHICDSAFFTFDKFYGILASTSSDLAFKDTTLKYDSLLTDSNGNYLTKPTGRVALYGQELKKNGFNIYMSEGDYYIGQDLDFVTERFYEYLSPAMKTYLTQLNKENKEGFSEDGGLSISQYELVDRTVWWEKFTSANPNSILTNRANDDWKYYLETLLTGMDNSPVTNDDGITIDDYYKTAYTYLQHKYPSSQTNKYVNPYFKLLLQHNHNEVSKLISNYKTKKII